MRAVIMAGGKGTRLLSLTNDEIPKPMAVVSGKPILHWQIEKLKENGIDEIVLVTGHLKEKIIDYFKDGSGFSVKIDYINEEQPLGSAGSLSMLKPHLDDEDFLLLFGDVLFDIDIGRMIDFHRDRNAFITLFAHPNAHPYDSDLIITDENDRVLRFDSKHNVRNYWYENLVNAGFYIMNRNVCDYVPFDTKTDLEKDLIPSVISDNKDVYAYRSSEYIKDVGTVERIQKAEEEINYRLPQERCLKNRQKAVFLDRDGTINKENGLVYKEEQFELEDWAAEAIRMINESGYLAVVITNQPVVARGLCDIADVVNIHHKMETQLGEKGAYLDDIRFCPHHPDKGYPEENPLYKIKCHCRKPDIGMIEESADKFNIDLNRSWFVGDSTVDVMTGKNAGTKTILLESGVGGSDAKYDVKPDHICDNLLEAVKLIIGEVK